MTPEQRTALRQFLSERFSLDEVKTLCFDLGLDYESVPHETDSALGRELLMWAERRGTLGCLGVAMLHQRPDAALAALVAALPPCTPDQKVVIVAPDELRGKLAAFMQRFAAEYGLRPEQVTLLATAPGSIQLLVSLPAPVAEQLLASQPTHLGGVAVQGIHAFWQLPPTTQQQWRSKVVGSGAPAASSGAALRGGIALWKLAALGTLALLALGTLLVGAIALRSAPVLTLRNQCERAFPLTVALPGLGSEIPPGESRLPLPPGRYRLRYTGDTLGLESELLTVPPLALDVPITITINGQPLAPQRAPIERQIGLGTRVEATLCAAP